VSKLLQRLSDPARSGVYRARGADDILAAASGSTLDVVSIDLAGGVFDAMAQALDFPDWFGRNWDALEDCLSDLSWRRDAGRILVLSNGPRGETLGTLVDVLGSAAQYWAGRGKAFIAVLLDPARKLPLPDLYRER
jgi:hypothetical protein